MPSKKNYTEEDRAKARRMGSLKSYDNRCNRDWDGAIQSHEFRSMIINIIEQDLNISK